jgi:arabinogalactan oligomer/maltooligosaccharide transport system substrate-binding protein
VGVDVKPVTIDTVQAVIIQSGFHTADEVGKCVPPLAAGVTVPKVSAQGTIVMWTKEGEGDGTLQWIDNLAAQFADANPGVKVQVINYGVETLREQFQTAALAGTGPDLLWTVNDHAGPFVLADLIQSTDSLFDLSQYVDSANAAVLLNGKHYGVPIHNGNHLMLYYNKKLIQTPPADTDALIALAPKLSKADGSQWTLVYNQTEPFWLVPWLGGFQGKVFADDGKTPTLNTPAMVSTLAFLKDLKDKKVVPPDSDYNGADTLFKEGKAAMIINGDWTLGAYADKLGADLGIARIPKVSKTGAFPAPYTAGTFFMFPKGLSGDKLTIAKAFVAFISSPGVQVNMTKTLKRLPALKAALSDPFIASDPLLKGSADQMTVGTPMPTNVEMRCNWDSMKPNMAAVLAGKATPDDAAKAMQESADACVAKLQ